MRFRRLLMGQVLAAVAMSLSFGAIPESERQVLIALYNQTHGDQWTDHAHWRNPEDPSQFNAPGTEGTWFGVGLDADQGHVVSLWLANNNLQGPIPTQIGELPALRTLALYQNALEGPLPPGVGSLGNLEYLYLAATQLTGDIPAELGGLGRIREIYLSSNQLSGNIPPTLGNLATLELLQLSGNQLTGGIPAALGSLDALRFLDLSNNHLNGAVPPELGNLSALQHLYLSGNDLSGSLPSEMGNLVELMTLTFSGNPGVTGPIPPTLGNLTKLATLDLWGNHLSGAIPPQLGNLHNLVRLYLGANQLSGSIPEQFGQLVALQELGLAWNQLSGTIPATLNALADLRYLDLSHNALSGPIPPGLFASGKLTAVLLSDNLLSGPFPETLCLQRKLAYLHLYNNQLSGPLPPAIGDLTQLYQLYLANNRFDGAIPRTIGNLINLTSLYLNGNAFTGRIPGEMGNLAKLRTLVINGNHLQGPIPLAFLQLGALAVGELNITFNALYTNDPALRTFLTERQYGGDWASSQTLAPNGISATAQDGGAVLVTWTPMANVYGQGGYHVYYSLHSGGDYVLGGTVTGKANHALTVTGLDPQHTAYFAVQSFTDPFWANQNTVESELSGEVSPTTLFAAHLASNALWWTRLSLINSGNSDNPVTLDAYSATGQFLETVTLASLPPRGSWSAEVDSVFTPATLLNDLWLRVRSQSALKGVVEFGTRDAQSYVALPMFATGSPDLSFPYVVAWAGWYTGVTLINTGAAEARVRLEARSESGYWLGERDETIPPNGKYVRLIEQVFPTVSDPSLLRFVRVASDQPLIGFELFGNLGLQGLAGLPAFQAEGTLTAKGPSAGDAPIVAPSRAATTVRFLEIPDNAEWYTGLTFSNLGSQSATFHAELLDAQGGTVSERDWSVNPLQQITREVWAVFDDAGTPQPLARTVRVTSPEPLLGFELYLSRSGPFRLDGIPAENRGAQWLYFPRIQASDGWSSKVKLLSLTDQPAVFTLRAWSAGGMECGVFSGALPAGARTELDLGDLFPEPPEPLAWVSVEASAPLLGDVFLLSDDQTRLGSYLAIR